MTDDASTYRGVLGAFPYAARETESRLFWSYVLAGGLVAAFTAALFLFGLLSLLGSTAGATGGSFALSRAFFVVVALLVVGPLVAPVLLVARRHRVGGADPRYDRALAAAGYLFLASLFVGLVVSAPAEHREPASGPLAPVVEVLYAADPRASVVPPLVAAGLLWLVHRRYR